MKANFVKPVSDQKAIDREIQWLLDQSYKTLYTSRATAIFGRRLKGGRDVTEWVADQLHIGYESGKISSEEFEQVMLAELRWGGQIRATQIELILVIEVSTRIEKSDVERAVAHAAILRRLGLYALPGVGAQEWASGVLELGHEGIVLLTNKKGVDNASWEATLSRQSFFGAMK